MLAPIRLVREGWPARLERRLSRFVWHSPSAVMDDHASPDDFREAMKAFYFGGTFKITGVSRHPLGDAMLVRNVDLSDKNIVDIGASDGSTSRDLMLALDGFGSFTIADRYLAVTARRAHGRVYFFDNDDVCMLIAGRRLVAWPSMSRIVHVLYAPSIRATRRAGAGEVVVLLNPSVRKVVEQDERVRVVEHDIFVPWPEPADVIKVANLLRRLYFPDSKLQEGLRAVLASLADGGYFLLVDNPRVVGIAERSGLYRRRGDHFEVVEETPHAPEISELIKRVRLGRVPSQR